MNRSPPRKPKTPSRSRSRRPNAAPAKPPAANALQEGIFSDPRAGRDRRDKETAVGKDVRRNPAGRRKTVSAKVGWWLQRDYVESHHFVRKPGASRQPQTKPGRDQES